MSKKLLMFTSENMSDPASRIRGYYMAHCLSKSGIKTEVLFYEYMKGSVVKKLAHITEDCFNKIKAASKSGKDTLIYIQRGINSQLAVFSLFFSFYSKYILRKRVVYDIDDALFLQGPMRAHVVNGLIKFSDAVIVGGHELFSYAQKYNKRTFIIPTSVELQPYSVHRTNYEKCVKLGFIGSTSTTHYLTLLINPLAELAKQCDFELVIMSASSAAEYQLFESLFEKFRKNGVKVKLISWSIANESVCLKNINIGLAPLFDTAWEKYKCAFKVINYMASGIPTAASAVGEQSCVIQDGYNGFLCKNDAEWFRKLKTLVEDEALRKEMGLAARKTVEEHYSCQKNAQVLANILTQL